MSRQQDRLPRKYTKKYLKWRQSSAATAPVYTSLLSLLLLSQEARQQQQGFPASALRDSGADYVRRRACMIAQVLRRLVRILGLRVPAELH